MKILILVGSSDSKSHSLSLGESISEGLKSLSGDVQLINLIDLDLPMYYRETERNKSYDEKVSQFLADSSSADAVVWVTPDYHNSYSAVLKNALDWQHRTKFNGKVVGLASNGGGRSQQPVDHLMVVARSQGYVISPTRVCTQESDYDEYHKLVNGDITSRVDDFCRNLYELSLAVLGIKYEPTKT